jgi:hypothetical protein
VGTLVKSVHDNVNWVLTREGQYFFQALYQGTITGLSRTLVVFQIKSGDCIKTTIGLTSELEENRKEKVSAALFIFVTKVAVKISHGRWLCLA